jgi:hypothetical protein
MPDLPKAFQPLTEEEKQDFIRRGLPVPFVPEPRKPTPDPTPVSPREAEELLRAGTDPAAVRELIKDRAAAVQEKEEAKLADWRKQLDAQSAPSTVEEFNNEAVQLKIADEYAHAPQVDPLDAWDVDTLAKNKQFSLETYVAQNPQSLQDEGKVAKMAQVWKERHKEPITAGDVAIGAIKLPWTTAKHIWKFGKGTGTTIYDSTVAPIFGAAIPSIAGELTGQGPEFQREILRKQEEIDRNLASDLAGLEQGSFNFASWISNVGKNLPRRFANTKAGAALGFDTWDDVPEDQLKREFRSSMENYLQGLRIGKGEGEFSQVVGGEFIREAKETGGLDEERVAAMAEADPVGFFMFGQAFRAAHGTAALAAKPLRSAEQLAAVRQTAGQLRQSLPPGDPSRVLAENILRAVEKDASTASKLLQPVAKVTVAADKLMQAQLRLRTANEALKRFGPSAERTGAVDRARAALTAVEEATAGQFAGRALASIKGAASKVSGVDLGVKAISAVPTAAGQVARGVARTVEAAPKLGGVALILAGRPGVGLGLLFGARASGLEAVARGAAKPLRAAQEGLGHLGRVIRSPEAATPFQKALQGVTRGSAEVVAEGLRAVPIDIGFALALAESPEDVQNMSGYASAFRALHAAGRPLSRFVQAVKLGPQTPQAPSFLPRQAGNVRNAAALTEAWRRNLPPEQQKWVAAQEQFLRDIGSEAPVYGMSNAQFKTFLTDQFSKRNGRPPGTEEAALIEEYSNSRGVFMEEVVGDAGERGSAMIITDAQSVPHEGMHAFQQMLGKNGNHFVDQLIIEEFAGRGEWDRFAQDYSRRLVGENQNWREAVQNVIPKAIKEAAGGDPVAAADIFLAREIAAENFAEMFKATGGRPTVPTTLTEKLATVVDRAAKFFGVDLLEGARTEALGAPVSTEAQAAIRRRVQQEATRVAGERAEGTLPEVTPSGRPTVREPVPGERPVTPPPAERAPNLREPPIDQRALDDFEAKTPERLNINLAREMSKEMPAEQQLVVDVIAQALQRKPGEAVVLELENLSVIPEHQQRALNRDVRRAEQAVPDAVRDFFSKRIAVTRFLSDTFSGGKLQLAAMSMDKVLANVFQLQERMQKAKATDLTPYEVDPRTGQLTENGWRSFSEDLVTYTANQANGGGKEIHRPEDALNELRIAIPAQNPAYRPKLLPDNVEQYINTIMGLKLPKTPRETKGIPPGNLKGQLLREAQGERVLEPADIVRRPKGFKRAPERRIQEVNPLRQEMNKRGVDTTKLLDVTERLNVDRLQNVTPRFELQFNLPATDVIRAGFQPGAREARVGEDQVRLFRGQEGTGATAGVFWTTSPQKAASFAAGGTVEAVTVPRAVAEAGKRAAEQSGQGGDTYILPPEVTRQARPVEVEQPVFELQAQPGERRAPTAEEIEIANRTARAAGSVGAKPTRTTQSVLERVKPEESVLDFGAGDKARQSELLREQGFTDVTAHEFGTNVREGVHDPAALDRTYDAVFASNVLNVQSSRPMLESTLADISRSVKPDGRAIFNFPKTPRKMEITPEQMAGEILKQFGQVERVGGTKSEPVWEARKPEPVPSKEEVGRTLEQIQAERNKGMPKGFTDPKKFGPPEDLARQEREMITGQKEFDFSAKEAQEYTENVPAAVRRHTVDTLTTKTPQNKAKPEITKPLAKTGVPVNQDGGVSAGPGLQAMPREWKQWLDEHFLNNPEVRKHYSEREIQNFAKGMEQTAKLFGDFSTVPVELPGSPIRQNSDPMFGLTFDLTTICPKQDQFVAVTRTLEAERGKVYTAVEKAQIAEMMREAGQAGCWICYGQGARNAWDEAVQTVTDVLNKATKVPDWKNATPEQVNEVFGKQKTDGVLREFIDGNIEAMKNEGEFNGARMRDLLRENVQPKSEFESMAIKPLGVVVQGAAKANAPKGFSPYVAQLLTPAMKKNIDFFNDIAGFRMNSQSDFRVWHTIDAAQFLSHLQSQKGMAHVYTRIDEMLQIFGKTGIKFNMSVEASDPATLPLAARVGNVSLEQYRQLVKRHGEPLWDDMNSFPEARVDHWRKALPKDAGSMLVAANDFQFWWGLENPKIDMIIPFHQGSVKPETTAFYGARDYTKQGQHEHFPADWKPGETRTVTLKSGEKVSLTMGGTASKLQPPLLNRAVHKNNKARYLEITERFGITPKFPRFVEHRNYMKLVRDAAREPMKQKVVDASKVDWEAAMRIVDEWVKSGAYEKETVADPAMVRLVRDRLAEGDLPKGPVVTAGQAADVPEIIKAGKKLRAKGETPEEAFEIKPMRGPGDKSVFDQIKEIQKKQGKKPKVNIKPRGK